MRATVVDLRYKMHRVLRALRLREPVTLLYHGKEQGRIMPARSPVRRLVRDSEFFGMRRGDKRPVRRAMAELRAPRHAL